MNEELKLELKTLGVSDAAIATLEEQELVTAEALDGFTYERLVALGVKAGSAKILADKYGPQPVPVSALGFGEATPAPAGSTTGGEEIPEGGAPTAAQVNNYASQLGMADASPLTMLLFANMGASSGMDMDLSGLLPIPQIVGGYNPKLRNIPFMVMGQIERRLASPIVVINSDGSVNAEHTVRHIMNLEEGFDAPEDNIYYDDAGAPFEIIKVGVDAQGIYDADPIQPSKALQQNGMGIGRINWHNVPLDVRQTVFLAATQTGELKATDEAVLGRLRDKIGPTANRLSLRGDFPKALAAYNEALRTGSLPTLRVQLSRSPRRQEVMPRRRTLGTNDRRDLNGLDREEVAPHTGDRFLRSDGQENYR